MKYRGYLRVAAVLMVMLAGRGSLVTASEPEGMVVARVLWYEEQEPGTDVYPVRMLITDGYLRIDDGVDESDFVLLERRTKMLYSVSHEEQTTLQIEHHPPGVSIPDSIILAEEVLADDEAPAIGGKQPRHVRLMANGTSCYEAVTVPGLLKEEAAALAEYARALGDRQLNNLQDVPEEMQTPCFLSRYAYAPDRHYLQGLPIQEWDESGYRRALVNFSETSSVSRKLFEVPASYQLYHIGG
jgi:hypothetical protein